MRIEIRSGVGTTVIEVPVMGIGEGDVPRLPTGFVPIPADTKAEMRKSYVGSIKEPMEHKGKRDGSDDEADDERADRKSHDDTDLEPKVRRLANLIRNKHVTFSREDWRFTTFESSLLDLRRVIDGCLTPSRMGETRKKREKWTR